MSATPPSTPSQPELVTRGIAVLGQAMDADGQGKHAEAIALYTRGLDHLLHAVKRGEASEQSLQAEFARYLGRLEHLKQAAQHPTTTQPEPEAAASSAPHRQEMAAVLEIQRAGQRLDYSWSPAHCKRGLQAAVARTRPPTTAAGFDPGVMLDATSWCVDHHERTQQRAQTQAVHAAVVVAPGSASAGQRPMLVQASVVEAGGLSPSPAPEVRSQQWADVTPSSTARIFAQSRAALPAGTPLKPELTQVVHLDKHEGGAMDRRWLRIRAPVAAVSAGSDAGGVMHVEWRATPRKKGQSWSVFVYREGAEGREQPLSVVQHSAGGLQGVVGHQAVGLRDTLRLEIRSQPGGNSGPVELSFSVVLRPAHGGGGDAAAAAPAAARAATACDLDYPQASFDALQQLLVQATRGWDPESGSTEWVPIPAQSGIMIPFTEGRGAAAMRVVRRFSSKARPHQVQFQDSLGNVTDTVMKAGDDLRQDQVVLGMLDLFNQIWAREGVTHRLERGREGGGVARVPVHAPTYRCMSAGPTKGFVEMLPNTRAVSEVPAHKSRGENGWRPSTKIIPTAVAGFVAIWALDIRDRHRGNMVVMEDEQGQQCFANIDFGWQFEGPPIDTGRFPIPKGLRWLMDSTGLVSEFHDLCFDAVRCLYLHRDELRRAWLGMLAERGLHDLKLQACIDGVISRLAMPREVLDK
jgi:hypothetical protein